MTTVSRFLFAGVTATLWVVPSIGTQGMGTIGARVVHPDATLIDTVSSARAQGRRLLTDADAIAETALGLSPDV